MYSWQLWVTQQNQRAVPSSLFVPCQGGEAHYELHGPQGVRIESTENVRPSSISCSRGRQFFLCIPLRMLLPVCPRQHRGQLEKQQWMMKLLQDDIVSQKYLIINVSYYKIHLSLPRDILEGLFVGAGEMAHVALGEDQSSVPRTPLDSSQLPVTLTPGGSQGPWSALMWTYAHPYTYTWLKK